MSRLPNVVIVVARCRHTRKSFGIRLEETERAQWTANWAFALKEASAAREGYDRTVVQGGFALDASYPGCPYCEQPSFFRCSCGKVGCWDGETRGVRCPWCGENISITGSIESLSAGGDR